MKSGIKPDEWTLLGSAGKADFRLIEPGVVAIVPHKGARDTRETAEAHMDFIVRYFQGEGQRGILVALFDDIADQDKGARKVYRGSVAGLEVVVAIAIIARSLLSRAMGSFFLGLSRLPVPIKIFAGLDEALHWSRDVRKRELASQDQPPAQEP